MARVAIPINVDKLVSGNWQPANGASVQVNVRGGGSATVYGVETGGSPIANPLTTDANGAVVAYADEGSYDLVVSGSGITTHTVRVELVQADALVTIGTSKLANNAVVTSKIADANVTTAKLADGSVTPAKTSGLAQVPTGVILPFGGSAAPAGYLLCDGGSYATATYPALFAVLGYAYGGSGASFNVPDSRGRALYGKGTHTDVDTLGKNDGLAVGTRRPNHNHTMAHTHPMPHGHGVTFDTGTAIGSGYPISTAAYGIGFTTFDHYHHINGNTGGASPGDTAGSSAANTGDTTTPALVVNHIVKT